VGLIDGKVSRRGEVENETKETAGWRSQILSASGWQNLGLWDSDFGARIRVLGTRILREVWDADFGGFVGNYGLVVGSVRR